MQLPQSCNFMSQRLRLHYVDWGNSSAPPLVLVHGRQDHCRSWDWVAQQLRQDFHLIALDLRGHGDSDWSTDGNYSLAYHVYDLNELIRQLDLAPVTIICHSMGGNVGLRWCGLYPQLVRRVIAIEGLGPPTQVIEEYSSKSFAQRMTDWISEKQQIEQRITHRYTAIADATQRMQAANPRLSAAHAEHLTRHGLRRNEDETFSWKFDNMVRLRSPHDLYTGQLESLWARITCPTLLLHGAESRNRNPLEDGRARYFANAHVVGIPNAGHWLHHDQLDPFMAYAMQFLRD